MANRHVVPFAVLAVALAAVAFIPYSYGLMCYRCATNATSYNTCDKPSNETCIGTSVACSSQTYNMASGNAFVVKGCVQVTGSANNFTGCNDVAVNGPSNQYLPGAIVKSTRTCQCNTNLCNSAQSTFGTKNLVGSFILAGAMLAMGSTMIRF